MNRTHLFIRLLIYILFCLAFLPFFSGESYPQTAVFFEKAEDLKDRGDFKQAIKLYEKGFDLALNNHDPRIQLECLINLGLLFWNIGKMEESAESYSHALHLAESIKAESHIEKCQVVLEIFRLYSDAKSFRARGMLEEAEHCFDRAVRMSRKHQSLEHELKCLRQMSTVIWQMNQYERFRDLNEQALIIADNLNHQREKGKILNHKGLYYWKRKDYSKALSHYQESLDIARAHKDRKAESSCLNNMGLIYKEFGFYDKALVLLRQALDIDRHLENPIAIAADLNNLGSTHIRMFDINHQEQDLIQALRHFEQSLALTQKLENRRNEVHVLNNIGAVYLRLNKLILARDHFMSSLELAYQLGDKASQGMILVNLGLAHLKKEDFKQAERNFTKAIETAETIQDRDVLWEAYFGLGKVFEQVGATTAASDCLQSSVDVIDSLRSQIVLDTNKARFVQHKLKVYEHLIEFLFQRYEKEKEKEMGERIFHLIERAKARSYLEMLGESRFVIRERLGEDLKQEEESLSLLISDIHHKLIQNTISQKERDELLTQMKSAEEDYLHLLIRIRAELPDVANMMHPEVCSMEQVQKNICDEKTAVVEYFLGDISSYLFVITSDEFHCCRLPPEESIRDSIRAYLKILSDPPGYRFTVRSAARRIFQELVPRSDILFDNDIQNVIIVPDGILYLLPFEALIMDEKQDKPKTQWLIERFTVSYSPSMSSLLYLINLPEPHPAAKSLFALGNPDYRIDEERTGISEQKQLPLLYDLYQNAGYMLTPLPKSEDEIKKISRLFLPGEKDIFLQSQASEKNVKKIASNSYRIIHFACHSLIDRQFPFRSALVLSLNDKEGEDGFLQVREICNLRFQADLVILSACQTGTGRMERGEGVLGLPRVFFYTGVRSSLSSLWQIDDKTSSRFMKVFYRYLKRGDNKASALRKAKLRFIRSSRAHPFFWGAFVLNGEWKSGISNL